MSPNMGPKPGAPGGAGLRARLDGALGAFSLDADLAAPAGEITSVFGPSGSGKTTLLRAISGLARLGGAVRFGESVWQDDGSRRFLPAHRRPVGFVFQQPALFPHLSVAGNLDYAARRADPDRRGLFRSDDLVESLALGPLLDRAPRNLSGGERQRVAFGRAVLTAPSVLLLDEPFSALDRPARARLLPFVRSLARERGLCVLHVSHDPSEVVRLADRLLLLRAGRIEAGGPAAAMLARLEDESAALGGGRAATLVARVVSTHRRRSGLLELDLAGQRLLVPAPSPAPRKGESARLRVPAREVALARKRPEAISVRNILSGRVAAVRSDPAGPFTEVSVEVGEARLESRITDDAAAELSLEPGTPVFALLRGASLEMD